MTYTYAREQIHTNDMHDKRAIMINDKEVQLVSRN